MQVLPLHGCTLFYLIRKSAKHRHKLAARVCHYCVDDSPIAQMAEEKSRAGARVQQHIVADQSLHFETAAELKPIFTPGAGAGATTCNIDARMRYYQYSPCTTGKYLPSGK